MQFLSLSFRLLVVVVVVQVAFSDAGAVPNNTLRKVEGLTKEEIMAQSWDGPIVHGGRVKRFAFIVKFVELFRGLDKVETQEKQETITTILKTIDMIEELADSVMEASGAVDEEKAKLREKEAMLSEKEAMLREKEIMLLEKEATTDNSNVDTTQPSGNSTRVRRGLGTLPTMARIYAKYMISRGIIAPDYSKALYDITTNSDVDSTTEAAGTSSSTSSGITTNSDVDSTTEAAGTSSKTSSGITTNSAVDSTTEAAGKSNNTSSGIPTNSAVDSTTEASGTSSKTLYGITTNSDVDSGTSTRVRRGLFSRAQFNKTRWTTPRKYRVIVN